MSSRTIRLLVASYLVKTALLAVAWLLFPELPQSAMAGARGLWQAVAWSVEP